MSLRRPARITYVVPDLGVGGAERHATTLMTRLDRSRFEPRVVCLGEEGELFHELVESAVPAVALGMRKRQALRCLWILYRLLREERPDVVIVRGYSAEALGRAAAVLARVPRRVVWVHNCGETASRSFTRRLTDRLLAHSTHAFVGVTEGQLPYLLNDLRCRRDRVTVVHNGVDVDALATAAAPPERVRALRDELGFDERDVVVGIVAALRIEKDHETFLAAARLLAVEAPTARFLVVGGGARQAALEALAARLGLRDRVVFTGPRDDVPALLRVMDVFVLSSYTVECAPIALLEAMALERAAVCTRVGGLPDIVVEGFTGFLVPPRDPAALAGRLAELIADPDRRRALGSAARARVEASFTWDQTVAETHAVLEDLVASRDVPLRLDVILDETHVGGVEVMLLGLFRAFDPRQVDARLICLREAGPLGEEFSSTGHPVTVLNRRGASDPRTLPQLVRLLRHRRTDAVLVTHHHRASLALGRLAARVARVPVNVVAVHDMDLRALGKRCLPRWAVSTLFASSALILLSRRQGDYLHREEGVGSDRWSTTKEVVIPNGVVVGDVPTKADRESARSELGIASTAFVVGIVARLTTQKGHQVLLQAFAALAESHQDAQLVVVGDGPRRAALDRLATSLGIADNVLFTGSRRDARRLLAAFDVFALSSVHEGLPVTVLEAQAAALPVVATDCGSLRDVVTDAIDGFLVPVADGAALSARLALLAGNQELRETMGRAARARVERDFRLETVARAYESLLTELVDCR